MTGVREPAQRVNFFGTGEAAEVAPRTWFVPSFANVTALGTDDGLLLVDTAMRQLAAGVRDSIRGLTGLPLHTAVFTHGHVDHAFGLDVWPERPRVIAHRNMPDRWRRYDRTRGLNEHINAIQFGFSNVEFPRSFPVVDVLYDTALTLTLGGERFELRHGMGETDDATWVWAPARGVLCTGDFWISCAPNCGNPQKVQRYAEGWISTLEAMAALGASLLLPGHGDPISGSDEVRTALLRTASYLSSIVEQTLDALNRGLTHEEVVAAVRVPAADEPYLQPVYDRPEFIVRNLIRLHAGWWDGHPANLLPAPADARAREIVALAGGVERVLARARELADTDLPLACHLAEWAFQATPGDRAAAEAVRDIFGRRSAQESSLMGRGIFQHAVRTAERALS